MIIYEIRKIKFETRFRAETSNPLYQATPVVSGGCANVVQNVFCCVPFKRDNTPSRKVWKILFYLLLNSARCLTKQCAEAQFKIKVLMSLSDKVEYRQTLLVRLQPQAAPKLLEKDG